MAANSNNKAAVASSTAAGQDVANLLTAVAVDDLVYQDLVEAEFRQDLYQRWPLFNTTKPAASSAKNLTGANLAAAAITSPYIALYGLRGGVGTTSMVAGLGWALAQLQHKVLLVDVATTPLLGQHFNCPSDSVPLAENQAYKQRLWELTPDLHLLDWQAALGANPDARLDLACTALTPELVARYAWVLLDLGCIPSGAEAKLARLRSTAQHSTAQHSTAQHSTAQHSTAQHSTCAEAKLVKSRNSASATTKNSWVLSSLALAKVDAATHLLLQEPASSKAMLLLNSYIFSADWN